MDAGRARRQQGGRYAKRCRTAQGRAGAGEHGEDGDGGVGSDGHVGDGHITKSLGSVSLTISWHLRPKAVRVSVSAGSLGPGGMRASGTVSANAGVGAGATTH